MLNYKRSRNALRISLIPLGLAQMLMTLPLSLWERFCPGPDTVIFHPISYYHWFALVGRAGNWLAVVVSVLMPLWLALAIWRLRPARRAWPGMLPGFWGCGVPPLNLIMALVWQESTPIGGAVIALQLAAVVLQFWPERA